MTAAPGSLDLVPSPEGPPPDNATEHADRGFAPAARVRGLRKTFGRVVAVDGVDLELPAGAVVGMLGPNGSGKTTLIRMLLGLTRPTAGHVELLGRTGDELPAALPDVGALVEGPGFHPFLSGRDNLLRAAALEPRLDGDLRAPVDAALERVGLTDAARRRYREWTRLNATLLRTGPGQPGEPWGDALVLVLTTVVSEAGHEVAVCDDAVSAHRLAADVLTLIGRIGG